MQQHPLLDKISKIREIQPVYGYHNLFCCNKLVATLCFHTLKGFLNQDLFSCMTNS